MVESTGKPMFAMIDRKIAKAKPNLDHVCGQVHMDKSIELMNYLLEYVHMDKSIEGDMNEGERYI
ncbi:hypothetical protein EUTSA_v10023816mg [Eutrema salsugineum]|uniref:Uncharacterized protein n=1 Tax=Eutrema salsugineum TaxID=72664 RepID=V4KEV0_EUTSA|nr:hypothetical protein EUTSA_v10023816mg [Eutrema salsugineum]